MNERASFRGQPLLLLVAIMAGWSAVRVAAWEPLERTETGAFVIAGSTSRALPQAVTEKRAPRLAQAQVADVQDAPIQTEDVRLAPAQASPAPMVLAKPGPVLRLELKPSRPLAERDTAAELPPAPWLDEPLPELSAWEEADAAVRDDQTELTPVRRAVGHNLLLAAGLSHMAIPRDLVVHMEAAEAASLAQTSRDVPAQAAAAPAFESSRGVSGPRRWSADAWLFVRDGDGSSLAGRPSYGRSQAGAVIRYRLAPASDHQPQAYMRASAALAGATEQDVAAGISGRPLPDVPLRVAIELRATRNDHDTDLRPSVFAVTEFPPLKLPLGTRGEAYLAGGYVGGRFSTGFVEGQARIERTLTRMGSTELTAGAGAWGGAQKHAARFDVGPTAAVSFRLGQTRSRLAVDYRIRVAGNAQPASGPALTLSAGF